MSDSQDAYEFTSRENQVIGKAATWALALSGASFVMVAIHLTFALVGGGDFKDTGLSILVFDFGAGIVSAACYLVVCVLGVVAGNAFRRVVNTEGSDLKHMMKALDTLHMIFVLRIGLVFLTVIAIVGVIAIGEGP